jgi:hypothetical protein
VALDSCSAEDYSGVCFLNHLGFYDDLLEEMTQTGTVPQPNEKLSLFLQQLMTGNKPISFIGCGLLPLLTCFSSADSKKWLFSKYKMTGISIFEESKETYFSSLRFICEEMVRGMGGTFLSSTDLNAPLLIIDRGLLSTQNDAGFTLCIKNLCSLVTLDLS